MRTVRESLGDLAFHDPIEAVDERWYEGVQEDWWHQNQMELILRGNSGEGEDNTTAIQGIRFNNAEIRKQTKGDCATVTFTISYHLTPLFVGTGRKDMDIPAT